MHRSASTALPSTRVAQSTGLSSTSAPTTKESFPVATGTCGTPTPTGSFYLTELLAPTDQGYGLFAYGLSAFPDALNSFGGGPGQIGLHGMGNEASIGHAVSHGCIRFLNADISELAAMLPLGTPITITQVAEQALPSSHSCSPRRALRPWATARPSRRRLQRTNRENPRRQGTGRRRSCTRSTARFDRADVGW